MMRKLAVSLALAAVVTPLFGAWMSEGPKREIETLTITANYKSPRLLAEIIQSKSRQPYILVPSAGSSDTNLYLCMPGGKTTLINPAKLPHFIHWTNPKRLLILGGTNYVPRTYEKQLAESTVPMVRIEGHDWGRIAGQLEFMLAVSGLEKNFNRLQGELKRPGGIYRPISRPGDAVESVKVESKTEAPAAAGDVKADAPKTATPAAAAAADADAPAPAGPTEKVTTESLN